MKGDKMKKELTQNLKDAMKIYKAMGKRIYWLDVMVKDGLINKSEAGYILTNCK